MRGAKMLDPYILQCEMLCVMSELARTQIPIGSTEMIIYAQDQ